MDKKVPEKKRRVIALLTREQMEFLDKLGLDALFSTGRKLTRVDIVSALVDAAVSLEVSGKGIKNKKDLTESILEIARTLQERRKYPRIGKSLKIGFRKLDSLDKYKDFTTKDISLGGFCMEVVSLRHSLEVGEVMEFAVEESHKKSQPIKALGRIAWIREKNDATGFEVGVALTYIKDKERFMGYLDQTDNSAKGIYKRK